MKRTIEKEEEEVLEAFDEETRVSDLEIREDGEGNLFALGPNREKALRLETDGGQLKFEKTVLNVEETEKVSETEGLSESEYYLEKKEASEEGESQIILVEPIQRGDEHVFF